MKSLTLLVCIVVIAVQQASCRPRAQLLSGLTSKLSVTLGTLGEGIQDNMGSKTGDEDLGKTLGNLLSGMVGVVAQKVDSLGKNLDT